MKRLILCALAFSPLAWGAEAFEASLGREKELPGGKEADGIRGDFVLRNDRVEAVISSGAPNRKANMGTFWGENGASPGSLYDLTLRGRNNDQLTAYCPAGHGPVSWVRLMEGLPSGEAAVEAVTSAGINDGIYKRVEYRIQDGKPGLFISTTLKNESDKPQKIATKSDLTRFNTSGETVDGIIWADAVNPAHKCGYAFSSLRRTSEEPFGGDMELAPGEEASITVFFAVATSPAQAVGEVLYIKGRNPGVVKGKLTAPDGPVTTAVIQVPLSKKPVPAYPDENGEYEIKVPAGKMELSVQDLGRNDATVSCDIQAGKTAEHPASLTAAARIRFEITDESGVSIPCKAHFTGLDGTPNPLLGPKERAHGCVDQYHSEKGSFSVQITPGKYRVVVVRGPEYGHLAQDIQVEPGKDTLFKGTLKRQVDTRGWISSDFHNHSTPSGDNVCDTDGRLINIAAEHLEFTPTTEHNRFFDWEPTINALGLQSFIKTVKGVEMTGPRQHINAFPFEPVPQTQDAGAPEWNDDPRITALTLRRWQGERDDRWIQFNHPDLSNMFVDRDEDGKADGGFVGVGQMIDGMEAQNGPGTDILYDSPFKVTRTPKSLAAKAREVREFVWKQLLNQGHRLVAVGVADAHSVYGNGVGCWRVYLPSSTDEPSQINWTELAPKAKQGNMVLTTGPFLEVSTADGKIAGDDAATNTGSVDLKVRVQCADWLDINRVQVLVNSRPAPEFNFTRETHPQMFKDGVIKFDETLHIPLKEDAHLIVVAMHETMDLKTLYGTSSYNIMRPCAYNNPIYVDVDGKGFKPNGDTLGHDLPVAGMTPDKLKAQKK